MYTGSKGDRIGGINAAVTFERPDSRRFDTKLCVSSGGILLACAKKSATSQKETRLISETGSSLMR